MSVPSSFPSIKLIPVVDLFYFFFSSARLPFYLYPFLGMENESNAYEYLRLTSLGVIGALVKVNFQNSCVILGNEAELVGHSRLKSLK